MEGRGTPKADGEGVIFYAKYGVVASTDPGWLQSPFDLLMGIFDLVGLRMDFCKTVGMVFRSFWETGVRADKAYTRKMTGEERSFKDRQQERVLCPECRKELAKGLLVIHSQTQHGMDKGRLGLEGY